jgi:sulfatase maturation enzyme AslB (radical SAM superfamily)
LLNLLNLLSAFTVKSVKSVKCFYCFSSEKSVEEYEIKSQSDNMSDFITYLEESSEKEKNISGIVK